MEEPEAGRGRGLWLVSPRFEVVFWLVCVGLVLACGRRGGGGGEGGVCCWFHVGFKLVSGWFVVGLWTRRRLEWAGFVVGSWLVGVGFWLVCGLFAEEEEFGEGGGCGWFLISLIFVCGRFEEEVVAGQGLWSVSGRFGVGLWSVCGRFVEEEEAGRGSEMCGLFVVGLVRVCGRIVVGLWFFLLG